MTTGKIDKIGQRTSYGRRATDGFTTDDCATIHRAAGDAIVMVNPDGTAVDCNNAFAQLCGIPAGLIVGRPLERFAPQLALVLDHDATHVESTDLQINGSEYRFEVRPFENQPLPGGPARRSTDGVVTRVVTLQAARLVRVA